MNVLLLGSGAREHAIALKLKDSPKISNLHFAPGNGGTASLGTNHPVELGDLEGQLSLAKSCKIDLVVIGPELPLALGAADLFKKNNIRVFGASKNAAKLETSKAFSKAFMKKYAIPTAEYEVFSEFEAAEEYLEKASYPLVVKADGLAAGKGVVICKTKFEAIQSTKEMMEESLFGESGKTVVIEEFLVGKEVSLICFVDGETILPMETASDYKKLRDGDFGVNTGGMGSISPSFYGKDVSFKLLLDNTILGIQKEEFSFHGIIYLGIILTEDGPKLLEYNVRFGDPEAEVLLPRLETDLLEVIEASIDKRLSEITLKWRKESAVTVVLTGKDYPFKPLKPTKISLPLPPNDVIVYHGGTKIIDENLLANGGRILAVTGLGKNIEDARIKAYDYLNELPYKKIMFYRSDIGKEEVFEANL